MEIESSKPSILLDLERPHGLCYICVEMRNLTPKKTQTFAFSSWNRAENLLIIEYVSVAQLDRATAS